MPITHMRRQSRTGWLPLHSSHSAYILGWSVVCRNSSCRNCGNMGIDVIEADRQQWVGKGHCRPQSTGRGVILSQRWTERIWRRLDRAEDIGPKFNRSHVRHPRLQDKFQECWSPQYVRDSIPHPHPLGIFLLPFLYAPLDHTAQLFGLDLLLYDLIIQTMRTGIIV